MRFLSQNVLIWPSETTNILILLFFTFLNCYFLALEYAPSFKNKNLRIEFQHSGSLKTKSMQADTWLLTIDGDANGKALLVGIVEDDFVVIVEQTSPHYVHPPATLFVRYFFCPFLIIKTIPKFLQHNSSKFLYNTGGKDVSFGI